MNAATLNFDGGCIPNPGMMRIGFVLARQDGTPLCSEGREIGQGTNNVAEYRALVEGLKAAVRLKVDHLDVRDDSLIVINRMNGKGKKRPAPHLIPLIQEAFRLAERFHRIRFFWIPREQNEHADALTSPSPVEPPIVAIPPRPLWLLDKFKTVEAQAQAYPELEKKLGAPKPALSLLRRYIGKRDELELACLDVEALELLRAAPDFPP